MQFITHEDMTVSLHSSVGWDTVHYTWGTFMHIQLTIQILAVSFKYILSSTYSFLLYKVIFQCLLTLGFISSIQDFL